MKILVINPNTSDDMTAEIDRIAKKYARSGTHIQTVRSHEGPRSIESAYEESLVALPILERIIEANEKKFDAAVIACFGDPHLQSAREISDIPVYGIAEAAMHMACLLGYRFSIVTVLERARPIFEELVKRVGLEGRCASIRTTSLSVLDIEKDSGAALRLLTAAGRKAIDEDGAEVICLGCAGMAGLDKPMEESLGVPVLDGVVCAVKAAEAFHDCGLRQSKVKAFKKPEPKEYVGMQRFLPGGYSS